MGQDGGIGLLTFVSELADRNAGVDVRAQRRTPEDSARTGSTGSTDTPRPEIDNTTSPSPEPRPTPPARTRTTWTVNTDGFLARTGIKPAGRERGTVTATTIATGGNNQ